MAKFVFVFFAENPSSVSQWLGLGYLLSSLKPLKNLQTDIKTYNHNSIDKAIKDLAEINPEFIGVSILQHNYESSMKFIQGFAPFKKNTHIVLGNIEATLFAEKIMEQYPQIDSVSLGEGEITLYELCSRILNNLSLDGCKGLFFRSEGKIIKNPSRPLIEDLDQLPFPDRSYVSRDTTMYSVIGSRGCIGNCSFCEDNMVFRGQPGKRVRLRSIKNTVDEIEMLVRDYNCKYVKLYDSTFCHNNNDACSRLESLYNELTDRKINILLFINIRCEQVDLALVNILKKLKSIGLFVLFMGIEAGNTDDLKLYRKRATVKDNAVAVNMFKTHGINYIYGFINFNPYTTIEKLNQNLEFLESNNVRISFDILSKRLLLYSGAAITREIYDSGLLTQDINEVILDQYGYNFVHDNIDKAYRLTVYCNKNFDKDLYELRLMIYSQFIRIFGSRYNEYEEIANFEANLQALTNKISIASADVFRTILNHLEESEERIIHFINEKIGYYNKLLISDEDKINCAMKIMYMLLKKNNELLS